MVLHPNPEKRAKGDMMIRAFGTMKKPFLVGLAAILTVFLCEGVAYAYAEHGGGMLFHLIVMTFAAVTMYLTFISSWVKKKLKRNPKKIADEEKDLEKSSQTR
jgi:O-antigen/teichoic acid export membrane protein